MAREIGLSRLTLFPLEDAMLGLYGNAIPVPWMVKVDSSDTIAEYAYYADNVAEGAGSRIMGSEITTELSSNTPPKMEAMMVGNSYINGALVATTEDKKQSYGVAWETIMDDGNLRRYFYSSVTFSKSSQTNETLDEDLTAQTYTYTGKAVPLAGTKDVKMVMDEREVKELVAAGDPKALEIQEVWDKWFEVAPRPVA